MKREIVFDTETTGMDPAKGHKIVEIGCVEIVNFVPTGRTFHHYINPERDVPAEVVAVHGLTGDFLSDKPPFVEIAADLVEFIGEAPLVAHNAGFDMKFLNAELVACGFRAYESSRVVDTLGLARRKAPGAPASLDALCKRFGIDNSNRTLHGALLDARLLADVYLELSGGRQAGLVLEENAETSVSDSQAVRVQRPPRSHAPNEAELAAHNVFLKQIKDPLWDKLV
jgi:DNA polymerase-3 subunit epsilon